MLSRRSLGPLPSLPLLLLSLLPPETAAQTVAILPAASYEYGAPLSITRTPGAVNQLPTEGFGTSYNHTFWVGADLLAGQLLGAGIDGMAGLRIGFSAGGFTSDPYSPAGASGTDSLIPANSSRQFQLRSTQTLARADLMLAWHPLPAVRLAGGGWGSMRLASGSYQSERIIAPDGALFPENGSAERAVQGGTGIETSPLHFGVAGGIALEFRFSRSLALHPSVIARCDLDAVNRNLGLRAFSIDAGLAVAFDLTSSPGAAIPDSMVMIAGRSEIRATVNLFNADAAGGDSGRAMVRMRHTEYSQFVPLPPFIFFEKGSDSIPARYILLETFPADVVADIVPEAQGAAHTPYETYYNVLNILGRRMHDDPGGMITLAATTAPDEHPALGMRRAGNVRRYLSRIWGIDSSRMRIGTDPGGGCPPGSPEEIAYVRIIPSSATLLAPAFSKWTVQDHMAPRIGLIKKIRSALGVRSWELAIRQGETLISRFTEENQFDPDNGAAIPLSQLALDGEIKPLVATLEVIDPAGASVVATDALRMELASSAPALQRQIRSYILLEPAPDCPETLTVNKALVASISGFTLPTSRIFVSSAYQGARGTWGASAVASEILMALKAKTMAPAELRMTNEPGSTTNRALLPEEMIFGRAVRVTLEQQGE